MQGRVVCSYGNSIVELDIASSENGQFVSNCPLNNKNLKKNENTDKNLTCLICQKKEGVVQGCPICNYEGSLVETECHKDALVIPPLAEFRIKAVRIGSKYKIIMTTENNQNLIAQSKECESDDNFFNEIFNMCENKIKNAE